MKAQFLGKWNPREAADLFTSLARYTRFVFLSKVGLLLVAFGLLAALIIIPLKNKNAEGIRIVFSAVEEGETTAPVMKNPRFFGVDKHNNPFTVHAVTAQQEGAEVIALSSIEAEMQMEDKAWLMVNAERGKVNLTHKNLQLLGKVNLFYGDGWEMRSEQVMVDMQQGEAFGTHPLQAQGAAGNLQASAFHIYDKGNRVVFAGPVKLRLYVDRK